MDVKYTVNPVVDPEEVRGLLKRSQLQRPDEDAHRLARIRPAANIVIAAYEGKKIVGLARGLKELNGCCYLSDLVVDREYHQAGIGEALIRRVRATVGDHVLILLVQAPDAPVCCD